MDSEFWQAANEWAFVIANGTYCNATTWQTVGKLLESKTLQHVKIDKSLASIHRSHFEINHI